MGQPTVEQLSRLLSYDPNTGELTWRERRPEWFQGHGRDANWLAKSWNVKWAGRPALRRNTTTGYGSGAVLGQPVLAHRVCYSLYYGIDLADVHAIDHIDGDKFNNRIDNLRVVTNSENAKNAKLYKSNKTGVPGVMWEESHKAWAVKISINGRQRRIARFKSFDEAVVARRRAEVQHGYHENHGRRGRA